MGADNERAGPIFFEPVYGGESTGARGTKRHHHGNRLEGRLQ